MNSFVVYEMEYTGKDIPPDGTAPVPFSEAYGAEYMRIYNACFYEMRKALHIQPFDCYSDIQQIRKKASGLFLLPCKETIIGSVGCFGSEIDDLIVNPDCRHAGYGTALLRWAIRHIQTYSAAPVSLHVAEWNQTALNLYRKNGFAVKSREIIRYP